MASGEKNILYLVQAYNNRGGTEQHTKDLAEGLSDTFSVSVAYPEQGQLFVLEQGDHLSSFPVEPIPWPVAPYRTLQWDAAISALFEKTKPDIIHIQHFINWPLSIIDRAADIDVPLVMSFHDYFPITPHFTMQGAADPAVTLSQEYSLAVFRQDITKYLAQRRNAVAESLNKVDYYIVPSRSLAGELKKVFPHEYRVIGHGINPFNVKPRQPSKGKLRFGFVGSLLPQKGWIPLVKAFLKLKEQGAAAELHLFGGGQLPQQSELPDVTFHGPYDQPDLPDILSKIDVGIVPSVFRETFCLVLSELWQAGIPAAVSDIGALGERIQDGVNGRVFPPGNVDAIAEILAWFLSNDDWKNWELPVPRTQSDMVKEYTQFYDQLLNEGKIAA